jgi:hypothetical protein
MPNDISVADRVAAGVAYLDRLVADPNWWVGDIDVDRLDINHCHNCVLGQIYGDYHCAPIFTGFDAQEARATAEELGFIAAGINIADYPLSQVDALPRYLERVYQQSIEMDALTTQWCHVIAQRQQQLALDAARAFIALDDTAVAYELVAA